MNRSGAAARSLVVAAVVAASFALSGCSLLGNIVNSGEGEVEGEGEATDVFTLKVGDCLNDAAVDGEVSAVPTVPCSEPHDSEAYESILLEDGAYPGNDAIQAAAEQGCLDAFSTFAGIAYADSTLLDLTWYNPTEEGWESGDREILCVIYEIDESGVAMQTVGSLEGANK